MPQDHVLQIDALLKDLGYAHRKALKAARAAMLESGLTRAGKTGISSAKREPAAEYLRSRFVLLCARDECRHEFEERVRGGRQDRNRKVLTALDEQHCVICGGSNNVRAAARLVRLLEMRRVRRVLVVGGSPASRAELDELLGSAVDLRLVSGTDRRTREEAQRDLDWADVVVIWGGTQLDHKVSNLYTHGRSRGPVLAPQRRGIEALADFVADSLETGGGGRHGRVVDSGDPKP